MARKLRVEYPGAIYHLMNRKDNMGWSGWEKFGNLTTYENEQTKC